MSNICNRCGTMVPDGAQFCPACGNPQAAGQSSPSVPQQQPVQPAVQPTPSAGQQQPLQQRGAPPTVQPQQPTSPTGQQQPIQPKAAPPIAQPLQQPQQSWSAQSPPGYGQPPQGYFQPPVKKDNKKKLIIAAVVIGLLYLYGNHSQQPVQQQPIQPPGTQQPVGQTGGNTQAIIQELTNSEQALQQIRQAIQNGNSAQVVQIIPQLSQAIVQLIQQIPEDQTAVSLFQIQLQRCQLLPNAAQGNRSALQQEMKAAAQFQQAFNAYCNRR